MASRDQVIAQLYPKIVAATQGTGVDPRIVMAQFLQETGGNLNAPGNNIFNITSGKSWQGPSITRGDTNRSGQKIQQQFRAYGSIDEAVADYVKFVTQNPRYRGTLSGSLEERAAALGSSGYAEDPTYGQKVLALARGLPGGTGASYPTLTQNANNIPGGYIPSELPAGGLNAPSGGGPVQQTSAQPRNIHEVEEILKQEFPELRVTSGYRSPEYNKKVGGAGNSQHTHGTAIDIGLKELPEATRKAIVDRAVSLGVRGIGYYPNSTSIHLDMREGAPAAWGPNYSKTSLGQTPEWFQAAAQKVFAGTGSTGAAYGQRTGANGIPGGYVPSELPAGGIPGLPGPPGGVLGPVGAEPPAPAAAAPAAPLAPFFARPNTDAARMLSDPTRYGLSSDQYAELRRQMEAGGPGGGTIGNIPAPAPAPTTPSAPPPAGVLSARGAEPQAPGAPPPSPHAALKDGGFFSTLFGPQAAESQPAAPAAAPQTGKQPTEEEREVTRKYLAGMGPGPIGIWNPEKIWSQRPEYAQPQPNAGEELRRFAEQHPEIRAWEGQNQAPVIGERPAPGGQGAATQMLDDWRNRRPLGLLQGGWT